MSIEKVAKRAARPKIRHAPGASVLAQALRDVGIGERAAFEQVYRLTSPKLFSVCYRLMPNRCEAEDVLQDAYCAIWCRAGSFDESRGTAMTWLITIARNAAIDRLRIKRAIMMPIELAYAVPDATPLASYRLEAADDQRQMVACLRKLPSADAALLQAAYFEGLAYTELAARACMPLGTIKSRVRRTLLRLRAELQ